MPSEEKRKEASFPKVWRDKGSWEIYFTILFWFGMGYITISLPPFPPTQHRFRHSFQKMAHFAFLRPDHCWQKAQKYATLYGRLKFPSKTHALWCHIYTNKIRLQKSENFGPLDTPN